MPGTRRRAVWRNLGRDRSGVVEVQPPWDSWPQPQGRRAAGWGKCFRVLLPTLNDLAFSSCVGFFYGVPVLSPTWTTQKKGAQTKA